MRRISQLLFFGALLLLAFAAGSATDIGSDLMAAAKTAFRGVWQSAASPHIRLNIRRFADVAASDAASQRVRLLAPALAGSVLMAGGRHRFTDRCPGFVGCVALEYDRHGRFAHAYPFRPEAFEAALVEDGLPAPVGYERTAGFDFAEHANVFAIDSYANGDLAVVLHSQLSFPSFLGIARIDRDGWPRWFRADGSHHWPTVAHGRLRHDGAGLADAVIVSGRRMRVGALPPERRYIWLGKMGRLECKRHFIDYLHVIDGDGALLRQIPIDDALQSSRHAPMLAYSNNPCGPLRLNSVAVLTAAGPSGLAAGDFLVSLQALSALAVFDGKDGRVKRVWRGSFYGQHGAHELVGPAGAAFLLFDNWGQDQERRYAPGRLLALDPQSGQERTIFPNPSSPSSVRLHSRLRGGIALAPDGTRAIVFAHTAGQGVEVDLASGEATAVFESLDDASPHPDAADYSAQAYRWSMSDIRYVAGDGGPATD